MALAVSVREKNGSAGIGTVGVTGKEPIYAIQHKWADGICSNIVIGLEHAILNSGPT